MTTSRLDSIEYDKHAKARYEEALDMCKKLEVFCDAMEESMYKEVAIKKLEQFHMWFNKALRVDQLLRVGDLD